MKVRGLFGNGFADASRGITGCDPWITSCMHNIKVQVECLHIKFKQFIIKQKK